MSQTISPEEIERRKAFSDRIHLSEVDLTDLDHCLTCTRDVDYIFHLAASVGGIQYIKKENVGGKGRTSWISA